MLMKSQIDIMRLKCQKLKQKKSHGLDFVFISPDSKEFVYRLNQHFREKNNREDSTLIKAEMISEVDKIFV